LLADGIQHVAGPGNIRKIDLGLNLARIHTARPRRLRCRLRFIGATQVGAHFFGLMFFHGTRVRLLFRDADRRKCVENRFAFDFQLPGQIVNSNLAHPPFLFSGLPR
jgi:hypothetical protein